MPRTFRRNPDKFNPEVLIYECEVVDNEIRTNNPISVNKQNRWDLLTHIKSGLVYGHVQFGRFKHKIYFIDDQYYMIVEKHNSIKVPDGQKISKLIRSIQKNTFSHACANELKKFQEKPQKRKNKFPVQLLDTDNESFPDISQVNQTDNAINTEQLDDNHHCKPVYSTMVYSDAVPEVDLVIIDELPDDFVMI